MSVFDAVCGRVTAMDFDNPCTLFRNHKGDCKHEEEETPEPKVKVLKKNPYFLHTGFKNKKKPSESNQNLRVDALLEKGLYK